ncbi:TOG array regulator of axonemal microtubules protein 2 [Bombina bombina]|uniref:TOG array regulator of axonemal microtubules protein 2 n=1 Tax=Bombina bombina TaxID=8345 RepID=UPI00235AD168|nr:TOG array regulator of axonemal microtubules protein 2 [Bombina bombina]
MLKTRSSASYEEQGEAAQHVQEQQTDDDKLRPSRNIAKFRSPVAVYCGSINKMKPGFRSQSIRNGSVDSNLQLCGNRWGPDTGMSSSSLNIQMKRSYMWSGDGDEISAEIFPPRLNLEGKNETQSENKSGHLSQMTNMTSKTNHREQEVDSAALETSRLKDKVKRKVSEGLGIRGAPAELISTVSAPLKPAFPRSASQRLLNATKPVPPIQRSPTPQTNGSLENGGMKNGLETKLNNDGQIEQSDEIAEYRQDPLNHACSSAEKVRKPLSGVLIPPIHKSSASETSESDPILSITARRSPVLKQSTSSKSTISENDFDEKSQKSLERQSLEKVPYGDQIEDNGLRNTEHTSESAPLKTIFMNSAKEADDKKLPELSKEEEGKENTERINFTISKSAQDKMRQKQMEIETLRQQKMRSQQMLWDQPERVDTGGHPAHIASFTLSGAHTIPASTNKLTGGPNVALNKWTSRPSLPSIPTVNPDCFSSDLRHSSAYSLPAYFHDAVEWDSDSENGGSGIVPLSHPEQGLIEALKWLNHKEWEQKEKGLLSVRALASYHPEVLFFRLHEVCVAVTREVSNLRSKVSRHAIKTLGHLFKTLKRSMDQEVEEIARVLLQKIGDSNDFIREESDKSLGIMLDNISPSKVLSAMIASGVNHRNCSVRKYSAKHLLGAVEQLGADKLLSGSRDNTDILLRTLVKLSRDKQQDTRFYGRRMLSALMRHPKFEGHMERLIPTHDLRDLIATIKQKEISDSVSEAPSARSQRPLQKSSAAPSQESLTSDKGISKAAEQELEAQESPVAKRQPVRAAEVTEQLKELSKLLTAKEFQNKMDGVTLLLDHCKNNIKFVSTNIVQIFDSFNPRLQDANKKVNQYALESATIMIPMLKDSLHHVLQPMVIIVTDNLNSKNSGIYTAAVTVLDTLISNIDHLWLLQPFASRIRFISGRAMSDITERLSVLVSSVYPRKPQAVERHALPVLWYFLTNITGNGVLPGRNGNFKDVVIKLTKSLHKEMGPSLVEYASSQPQHAIKMLDNLLGLRS